MSLKLSNAFNKTLSMNIHVQPNILVNILMERQVIYGLNPIKDLVI